MEEQDLFCCELCGEDVPLQNRILHSIACGRHRPRQEGTASSSGGDAPEASASTTNDVPSTAAPTHSHFSNDTSQNGTGTTTHASSNGTETITTIEDHEEHLVECEYCSLPVPIENLDEHSDICGTQTDTCDLCSQRARKRDMRRHVESGCDFGVTGVTTLDAADVYAGNNEMEPLLFDEVGHREITRPRERTSLVQSDVLAKWAPVAVAAGAILAIGLMSRTRGRR